MGKEVVEKANARARFQISIIGLTESTQQRLLEIFDRFAPDGLFDDSNVLMLFNVINQLAQKPEETWNDRGV